MISSCFSNHKSTGWSYVNRELECLLSTNWYICVWHYWVGSLQVDFYLANNENPNLYSMPYDGWDGNTDTEHCA